MRDGVNHIQLTERGSIVVGGVLGDLADARCCEQGLHLR
jgi:hypothetical protein